MHLPYRLRFFVHAAGQAVELSEQSIGRFGIGFKSCYRIASEVFVYTWDPEVRFGFRLPICREADPASEPDHARLEPLLARLEAVGVNQLDPDLRDSHCLGYCTPEFLAELEPGLASRTGSLCQQEQGTLFCFHLRPDRREEVASRITGQEREIYELCPLFLPNLRSIQLAHHQLEMAVRRPDSVYDVPGVVQADKVTLSSRDLSQARGRQSNSRFWRLRGMGAGDAWCLALHADSESRLRMEQEEDEHGTTIKDGSAYAFFPLNGVGWPFRLHLHLQLPTNLARDDWNRDDSEQVKEQLRRALGGLAVWLEQHTDKWHPKWRVSSLLARKPSPTESWACYVWELFREVLGKHRLRRTLLGNLAAMPNPRAVMILEKPSAQSAWRTVLSSLPESDPNTQLVPVDSEEPIDIDTISASEVANLCIDASSRNPHREEVQQAALSAFLGCHNLQLHRSPAAMEDVVKAIRCRLLDGTEIGLAELFRRPSGTELTDAWHATFREVVGWSDQMSWANASAQGKPLPKQLEKLSKAVFNPLWEQVACRMTTADAWHANGDQFWQTQREPCPEQLQVAVVTALHVRASHDSWLPIAGLWLLDETMAVCFNGILARWTFCGADPDRKRILSRLREWDLFEAWESDAEDRLRGSLPPSLVRSLTEHSGDDALAIVFSAAFERGLPRLPEVWRVIVTDAEKTAVRVFLDARQREEGLHNLTLLSREIPSHIRAALELLPNRRDAPPWLTEASWKRIRTLGLLDECKFSFLTRTDWSTDEVAQAHGLLESFHRWTTDSLSELQVSGLSELMSRESIDRRRDWTVGVSVDKRPRLRELGFRDGRSPDGTPASRLRDRLMKQADWRVEPLPPVLAKVRSVTEACVRMELVELDVKFDVLAPINDDQLPQDLQTDPDFKQLLEGGTVRLFGSRSELHLCWVYSDQVVARLPNADFVLLGDRLVVHRFGAPQAEEQYSRILSQYETHATPPAEYAADRTLPPYERYQRHRPQIRATLLRELVNKVGYEKHHVLRELLQNAESAYASQRERPSERRFEFSVAETGLAGRRQVTARHAGRTFNESDNEGRCRHDVERVWRLAAESERTPEEIGRFNRGFKTLFTVASDGVVRISSGPFDFEVIDLLLLRPPEPKPTVAHPRPDTAFVFEVTLTDALAMLRWDRSPSAGEPLPPLNASSLVFLRHLSHVVIHFEKRSWSWAISRCVDTNQWEKLSIRSEPPIEREEFLVFAGSQPALVPGETPRRFSVALRLDEGGLPRPLEKTWRCFRLTFETDQPFPLDFLVNGDFDADQGRIGLRNIARSGLVELAHETVVTRAKQDVQTRRDMSTWLSWARVLHLRESATELDATFRDDARPFRRLAEDANQFFVRHIPHAGELVPAFQLEFPTRLMRRLGERFATEWGMETAKWVDSRVAELLPDTEQPRLNLSSWLTNIPPSSSVVDTVLESLESLLAAEVAFDGVELDELRQGLRLLKEKLHPTPPSPPPEPPPHEPWTVANLWHWWQRQGKPMADYTLDGENWALLYPQDATAAAQRVARLRQDLSCPSTDCGRRVWYRLLGLACLMSAGWGRMTVLRGFWRNSLEANHFWELTSGSGKDFGVQTRALFSNLVQRTQPDAAASGEAAAYWRHVFYDIRKVHELVWRHDFADTVLQFASDPARARDLPQFLRSGQIPGQKPWAGVLGQSAGAPLFFVVRELCRLRVVNSPALKPLALFTCTPVRRAAVNLGWLDSSQALRTDFESLAQTSERLYEHIEADAEFGRLLLGYFDIPLLHFGLTT